MKIAIIGTGGVGGYFGGKLASVGNDVTFIARGKHLEAIKNKGLQVKSTLGDFHLHPVKVTDQIHDLENIDLVILGVKAWQIKDLAGQLKSVITADATVLPLQNGVLTHEELISELDPKNVVAGLCKIITKIESPGTIVHSGVVPKIIFGEINNNNTERVQKIKNLFDQAGISSEIAEDIEAELWKKFMAICISGLLAVTKTTYGVAREKKETREMMRGIIYEIFELSKKAEIKITTNEVEDLIAFFDTFPYDATSSLTRDVWNGRPSEIEYQNGTVVKLGDRFGVETPINRYIYESIVPLEKKARKNYL